MFKNSTSLFSTIGTTVLATCFAYLPVIKVHGDEPGYTSLLNGTNLDGWAIENNGQFSVRDGMLVINKGTGWLRSEKEYGDFVLKMDFRFLEEKANSGIFVRTGATSKDDENGWPDNGYQIQCMTPSIYRTPAGR